MTADTPPIDWETELAELLTELTSVQDELLTLLQQKREQMLRPETAALAGTEEAEHRLCERLQACHGRRQRLLDEASSQGLRAASIGQLTGTLPNLEPEQRNCLDSQVRQASARTRLVQHQCLTNWVLAQQSLLHLTQILEIVASGGRLKSTYGDDASTHTAGSLVDKAA